VDLAGLGIDEEGLDLVAVAPEQRVGERAVAPVHARPMQVDEQPGHRVEQPIAVRAGTEREPHHQAPVLNRVLEVFGDQHRGVVLARLAQTDRLDRRQAPCPEVAQDVELGAGDGQRLLLERVRPPIADEEPDEMARGADRQLAEAHPADRLVRLDRPLAERAFPGQVEQFGRAAAQPKSGEPGRRRRVCQSFLRR
jgi:hypothetical protein